MQIHVKLLGSLRDVLPREQRGSTTIEVDAPAVVGDVLSMLEIDRPVLIALNEDHEGDYETALSPGDSLIIFEQSAGG